MTSPAFQIKGTSVTSMALELYRYDAGEFARALAEKVASAPQFFRGSPLFLNLAAFEGEMDAGTLGRVAEQCREQGFELFGLRGGPGELAASARELGLVTIPASRTRRPAGAASPDPESAPVAEQASPAPSAAAVPGMARPGAAQPARVVRRPVRSGQQVYAEGADLILLAPVSEGAEVIADGHIHAYAPLRGRALAGVRDNPEARIFCQQLEAELVSVAGHFVLNDTLRESFWKQPVQIFLQGETIEIAAL